MLNPIIRTCFGNFLFFLLLVELGTIEGYSILEENTHWSNSNEVEFSATGNHPTRALGLLHLLCRFFRNGKPSFCLMSNCTRSLE
jgi:hypothetical protein